MGMMKFFFSLRWETRGISTTRILLNLITDDSSVTHFFYIMVYARIPCNLYVAIVVQTFKMSEQVSYTMW